MNEKILTQILSELKEIKTTMATKEELDGLKQDVSRIEEKQNSMDERMDRMEKNQDSIAEQVAKNMKGISSIRAEQQEMKADIAGMKELVGQIPAIRQAVMETSQDVKTLMTSQAKQDKILERLSVRSIEHEADIAELRKIK